MKKYYIDFRNILGTIKIRKVNRIGHILRRNFLLINVIEAKLERGIEVKGRRGRRSKQLLNELQKNTGYLKWKRKQ